VRILRTRGTKLRKNKGSFGIKTKVLGTKVEAWGAKGKQSSGYKGKVKKKIAQSKANPTKKQLKTIRLLLDILLCIKGYQT